MRLYERDPSRKAKSDKDEDEEDEIEVKYRNLSKEVLLGAVETNAKLGIQIKEDETKQRRILDLLDRKPSSAAVR